MLVLALIAICGCALAAALGVLLWREGNRVLSDGDQDLRAAGHAGRRFGRLIAAIGAAGVVIVVTLEILL